MSNIAQTDDKLMLIHNKNSVLSFDFPALLYYDEKFYSSVEKFVFEQSGAEQERKSDPSRTTFAKDVDVAKFYSKALKSLYSQSLLNRKALLDVENEILIDLR